MNTLVNVADLINPETGKTYREENLEKQWAIPLGSVVKVLHYSSESNTYEEHEDCLVLYVVNRARDCDGTPLYWLSSQNHLEHKRVRDFAESGQVTFPNESGYAFKASFLLPPPLGGYTEQNLKFIREYDPKKDD